MFADRRAAGVALAEALRGYRGASGTVVLGVPRGGIVVAAEVARTLGLPLDVVVVRKIGAPGNPEYAIGAVDQDGNVVGASHGAAGEPFVTAAAADGRREIRRRLDAYRGGRPDLDVRGLAALLVDDGIATGMTLRAAVESLKRRGAVRVVVAAPVAAPDSVRMLERVADEVVVLDAPAGFYAVGQFYRVFDQTTDAEVVGVLAESWAGA